MEEIVPNHKYFDTQKESEEVLFITRRHWIVYIPSFFVGTIIMVFCLVFYTQMDKFELIGNSSTIAAFVSVFLSIFMLFTLLFVYITWIVNYLNLQIVTTQNLVDVDQLSLFSRKISELALEDIQDVSATQHGILQSVLHYGDIVVQTAGEKMNFTFEKIENPYDVSKKIMEAREKYGQEEVSFPDAGMTAEEDSPKTT